MSSIKLWKVKWATTFLYMATNIEIYLTLKHTHITKLKSVSQLSLGFQPPKMLQPLLCVKSFVILTNQIKHPLSFSSSILNNKYHYRQPYVPLKIFDFILNSKTRIWLNPYVSATIRVDFAQPPTLIFIFNFKGCQMFNHAWLPLLSN